MSSLIRSVHRAIEAARLVVNIVSGFGVVAVINIAAIVGFVLSILQAPHLQGCLALLSIGTLVVLLFLFSNRGDVLDRLDDLTRVLALLQRRQTTPAGHRGVDTSEVASSAEDEEHGQSARSRLPTRDDITKILDFAVDNLLSPVRSVVFGVPVVLAIMYGVSSRTGHPTIATACAICITLAVLFGMGPYCAFRILIRRQFDLIGDLLERAIAGSLAKTNNTPNETSPLWSETC